MSKEKQISLDRPILTVRGIRETGLEQFTDADRLKAYSLGDTCSCRLHRSEYKLGH